MARARMLFAFGCVIGACVPPLPLGRPADAPPPFDVTKAPDVSLHYRAGKRIRPRWRVTSDGARELVALHDSVLDLDCKFVPTVSGLRCVPDPEAEDGLSFQDNSVTFRDKECTEPVAWAIDVARRKFIVAREATQTDCPGAPARVYRVATTDIVTELYHRRGSGKCGGRVSSEGGFAAATLGAEITSELAPGKLRIVAPAPSDRSGVAVAYVESEDGAIAFDHWVDPGQSAPCTFRTAADGIVRCLPDGPPSVYFADDACAVPGVSTTCAPPRFILRQRSDCSDRVDVLRGGRPTRQQAFLKDADECSKSIFRTEGALTYASAGEIGAGSFVGIEALPLPSKGTGAPRLRANDVRVGALRMRNPGEMPWHDTKLGVDCLFTLAADSVMRCLPNRWLLVPADAFTDADCSVEAKGAYVPYVPAKTCGPPGARSIPADPRYRTRPIVPEGGGPILDVHTHVSDVRFRVEELGPWPAATPLYVRDGKKCTPMPAAEQLRVRTPMADVAPAAFDGSRETE